MNSFVFSLGLRKRYLLMKQYKKCLALIFTLFISGLLVSCEKDIEPAETGLTVKKADFIGAVEKYANGGVEIVYPVDWTLLHDAAGITADRDIAFETPEVSRITVYFSKTSPMTYYELADRLERQLNLVVSSEVDNYKRKAISLAEFKGLELKWQSTQLNKISNEVIILQIKEKPFPVNVQFQLFDEDIQIQKSQIILILMNFVSSQTQ